jgi:hypothetical protein
MPKNIFFTNGIRRDKGIDKRSKKILHVSTHSSISYMPTSITMVNFFFFILYFGIEFEHLIKPHFLGWIVFSYTATAWIIFEWFFSWNGELRVNFDPKYFHKRFPRSQN